MINIETTDTPLEHQQQHRELFFLLGAITDTVDQLPTMCRDRFLRILREKQNYANRQQHQALASLLESFDA